MRSAKVRSLLELKKAADVSQTKALSFSNLSTEAHGFEESLKIVEVEREQAKHSKLAGYGFNVDICGEFLLISQNSSLLVGCEVHWLAMSI